MSPAARGFIGSAVIWELNRRGITDILVCDVLGKSDKWKNLSPLRFADYIEAEQLFEKDGFLDDIRCVFHLGACSSTTETDASYLIKNNFEYTKRLAHLAVANEMGFVYASSAATYGGTSGDFPESVKLQDLRPLNMYGYSKHLFDLYAERSGMLPKITGLKYFNIFGPNENHKGDMRSLVSRAFEQISETGALRLYKSYRPEFSDGGQLRDFMYVKDAVAATVFLAENVDGSGLFNIGSGQSSTWQSLAEAIFKAMDREPHIEFIDMPQELRERYQYFTCANIEKLREAGFRQNFTPLEDAVQDYVQNYLVPGRHLGDEAMKP